MKLLLLFFTILITSCGGGNVPSSEDLDNCINYNNCVNYHPPLSRNFIEHFSGDWNISLSQPNNYWHATLKLDDISIDATNISVDVFVYKYYPQGWIIKDYKILKNGVVVYSSNLWSKTEKDWDVVLRLLQVELYNRYGRPNDRGITVSNRGIEIYDETPNN